MQLAAKSARRADESPIRALSGLTLTKMPCILRQPQANFATAKFRKKKALCLTKGFLVSAQKNKLTKFIKYFHKVLPNHLSISAFNMVALYKVNQLTIFE